jgi:hypothetical protein
MLERLYNLSTIYGIITIVITIISIFQPQFALPAFVLIITRVLMALWQFYGPLISMKLMNCYDDFDKGFREDLWECRLPLYTVEKDPNAVILEKDVNKSVLKVGALKHDVGLEGPLRWEGPEIVARKKNMYNCIMAKIALNFEESTADEGNIYLCGRGPSRRFHYLIGIDKSSKDVFFHIWDREEKARYGPPDVGSYIKEKGRTHLKDYLKDPGKKFLILGIEWGFDGVKILAFKDGEKNFIKIPANPPPEIREEILKDSRNIYLFGLPEFIIRIDLVAKDSRSMSSIKGEVDYVKGKITSLSWAIGIMKGIFKLLSFILRQTKLKDA